MVERLTRAREVLVAQFRGLFAEGQALYDDAYAGDLDDTIESVEKWDLCVKTLLQQPFMNPGAAKSYPSYFERDYFLNGSTKAVNSGRIKKELRERLEALSSISERLDLYEYSPDEGDAEDGQPPSGPSQAIFVIHGRSDLRHEVARFLKDATNAENIILSERSRGSKGVMEEIESFAESVGFAVALLTGDDSGGLMDEPPQPRARQNVIFELGFFIGKLGRMRVAVLYREGVELPSDLAGVIYTSLEKSDWKTELGRKLKAAGFEVDLNRALIGK